MFCAPPATANTHTHAAGAWGMRPLGCWSWWNPVPWVVQALWGKRCAAGLLPEQGAHVDDCYGGETAKGGGQQCQSPASTCHLFTA